MRNGCVSVLLVCVGSGLTEKWITSSDLHYMVWQSVDDGEGYVRAAVVNALASLHSIDVLWRDFTHRHASQACHSILTFHLYLNYYLLMLQAFFSWKIISLLVNVIDIDLNCCC